jgi:hypothetical protein
MWVLALVSLSSAPAFAHPSTHARDGLSVVEGQGSTTSSISGTIVDAAGGVIPGATVTIKNNATNVVNTAVSNAQGGFTVPALEPGSYSIEVALQGFKTAVIKDVRLAIGVPQTVKLTLEVGALTETVEVRGGSELVNTQTATVASTLSLDQINKMPMPTRNAVNAVTFLPGVNTAGVNRDSNFNGLPDSFVAISLDGVNNNENFNKSTEGLFAMVTPRQDAIEAITITTATPGADIGGHGAVQIAFQTRSGSNRFTGSGYHYYRQPDFNSNYWFNQNAGQPKNDIRLNQYGARQGGPIVLPGMYDGRGKAFFFFNYEELRLPNNFTRTRTILNPLTQTGIFRYNVTVGGVVQVREVNVFALPGVAGHGTALDPTVATVLNAIRAATQATDMGGRAVNGLVTQSTDPNLMSYQWQSPGNQVEKQPVVRLDYNLSSRHRLSGTYNWQVVIRDPDHLNGADVRFPNLPNYRRYVSYRPLSSATLRSTLSPNMVNELKGGMRWGPSYFGNNASNGPQTYEGSGGFALGLGLGLTNYHTENAPSWRSAWSWNIDDTVSWQKGRHNFSIGGSLYFGNVWLRNQQMAPAIGFGVDDADPAVAMFSSANFPGSSQDQRNAAEALYALLTGRVNSISANATLNEATNEYELMGIRRQAGRQNEYSLFIQDSWRATPTLTINAGVRWDVQMPFYPVNDVLSMSTYEDACGVSGLDTEGKCRFFQPNATGGKSPTFVRFDRDKLGWKIDWNNLAPNVGVAWRPNVETGIFRTLLGDPEQATVRAGYSVAYAREGMAVYTGQYGANPGSQLTLTRNAGQGNLIPAGQSYPILLSQRERLTPAAFPATVAYPIAVRPGRADNINIFAPDIEVAYARSYNISLQRAISKDMAVDVRYVGTRGLDQWTEEDYNERNLIENQFYSEFRLAMTNLQANLAAGRGGTFAYFGPGTGTSPLPTYLAYFNARPVADAGNAALYTGSNWTNATFVSRLAIHNPNPAGAAGDLDGNAGRRANAIAAGLPANHFVLNPDVGSVGVFHSNAYSSYDALQIEVRRRLSNGFQINGSYQYALEYGSAFLGYHYGRVSNPTQNVRHAIKMQWDWSVPVGRGRRFGTDMHPVLDAVVGGWEFNGAGRIQARTLNFGNVRVVGMSLDELTKEYRYRIMDDPLNPGRKMVKMLPDDIILNTQRAFSVDATSATGYSALGVPTGRYIAPANSDTCIQLKQGDCAPRTTLIRAPWFGRIDVGLTKRFQTQRRVNFELRLDVLNVFNNINFNPVANPGTGATIFQVTSAYTDTSNTFDPGGRVGQLVWRINW